MFKLNAYNEVVHSYFNQYMHSVCLNSQVQAVFHFKLFFYNVIYSRMH